MAGLETEKLTATSQPEAGQQEAGHQEAGRHLPGSPSLKERAAAMIRVDQAGEYGAARIYAGQLAVMGSRHAYSGEIRRMAEQEQEHLDRFNQMVAERGVRPTALQPLWNVAGFALGAATALMGPRAAMAATAAIEDVIEKHYAQQLQELGDKDPELSAVVKQFRDEELEHHHSAIAHGAEETPGYSLLSAAIKTGCRIAIRVAERI